MIKLNISNLDICCKTERGFCIWVSYKQKPIFVFKNSSSLALGLHFTSITQNRKIEQNSVPNTLLKSIFLFLQVSADEVLCKLYLLMYICLFNYRDKHCLPLHIIKHNLSS